jgi:hypothetical protein
VSERARAVLRHGLEVVVVGFLGEDGRLLNGLARMRLAVLDFLLREADLDLKDEFKAVLTFVFSLRLRERMRCAIGRGENLSGEIGSPTEDGRLNFSVLVLWGV